MKHKLDYLFIGAHPDDCEIFAGGTILHLLQNYRVGICDLTQGELGTYGSIKTRQAEIKIANKQMNLSWRKTLKIKDGEINNDKKNISNVIDVIRKTKPKIIFTFTDECRHPDHSATHHLVKAACFLAGVRKYQPLKKSIYSVHRPDALLFFPEFYPLKKTNFIIDITSYWEQKKELIKCYHSQVSSEEDSSKNEKSKTFIKSTLFWQHLETTARQSGMMIHTTYGEAFHSLQMLKIMNPLDHYTHNTLK